MTLKNILSFFVFIIFLVGCKSDPSKPNKETFSDKSYKHWLIDTLSILKNKNNQVYFVNQDSSSLMIKTKIDTFINNKSNIDNPKALKYAVSLLQRNHILPKNEFRLISVTQNYYDLPYKNTGLSYDFQIDVVRFFVINGKLKKEYKFMKGNLTDSTSITSLPDIQKL